MKDIRSFDVFDTCLTRRIGVPTAIFYDVAERVYLHLGTTPNRALLEDFVAARIEAERIARERALLEDIGLDAIWKILALSLGWDSGVMLLEYELAAEEDSLVPIIETRAMIQSLRQQGHRIIFVSDMYLPKEFIEKLLLRHGFAQRGDGIYVSGEIGKMKISGNLFKHVLNQENVHASQILHLGDNTHSDYTVPRSLGIRAELFQESQMTDNERCLLKNSHDPQASSKVAGAMRAFRSEHDAGDANITELVSQFIGPFVMGFAVWVLQQAQAQGIRRLYFLSRDCQMVWKVARTLSPMFGGIDCRYLYVSRQALYLPSATEISPEGMPWMRRSFEEPILKNLLAKIELTYEEVASSFAELACDQGELFRLRTDADWKQFWKALNQQPVRERLYSLIKHRKKEAKIYYQSQGLFDDKPWAIVDLGWYLTGQQSLWKMLQQFGWNKKICGYYLALKHGRNHSITAGLSEALIYESSSDFQSIQLEAAIFQYQTLLEHIIGCADHPTVHHYAVDGAKVGPVFTTPIEDSVKNFATKLHSTVLDFVANNISLVAEFKKPAFCSETLSSITCRFFKCPSEKSAKALHELSIATDQNGLDAMPLVQPLGIWRAVLALRPNMDLYATKSIGCYWEAGALALTPKRTVQIARILAPILQKYELIRNAITMRLALRSRLRRMIS